MIYDIVLKVQFSEKHTHTYGLQMVKDYRRRNGQTPTVILVNK